VAWWKSLEIHEEEHLPRDGRQGGFVDFRRSLNGSKSWKETNRATVVEGGLLLTWLRMYATAPLKWKRVEYFAKVSLGNGMLLGRL